MNKQVSVPRMRTVDQAAQYIKEMDPDTKITAYRIRKLVYGGELPHTSCGRTTLVNLDELLKYLEHGGRKEEPEKSEEQGTVSQIERKKPLKRVKIRRLIG